MSKQSISQLIFSIIIIFYFKTSISGEILGNWNSNNDGEKIQIQINPCHYNTSMLCAKISNLELAGHHQPYLDHHNPDQNLRNRSLIGLEILRDLIVDPDTPDSWKGGNFYNPKDGENYSCSIQLIYDDKGEPILRTRIFLGFEFIGKYRDWIRYSN